MPQKPLEDKDRENHINRVCDEIMHSGGRLGFFATPLCEHLRKRAAKDAVHLPPYLKFDSVAWGIGVSISLYFKLSDSPLGFSATAELSWSSMAKTVSQAVHAVTLYQRAIEMAAIIEGVLG